MESGCGLGWVGLGCWVALGGVWLDWVALGLGVVGLDWVALGLGEMGLDCVALGLGLAWVELDWDFPASRRRSRRF